MDVRCAVIIPTHRRPHLLARAIRSVAAQSKPPAEVIIVNDSPDIPVVSTDTTAVRVIETMGGEGPSRARAMALARLDGSTNAVCYLDDDDELLPNHIELLSAKLAQGANFAFSRAIYRYADGAETEDPEPGNKGPKRYYDPNALLSQNIAPVSSFMHTTYACDKIGGWDLSLVRMEDWDFWGRMFIEFGAPTFVDAPTNIIYKGEGPNRTDSSPLVYSMACSWRDIVDDRLKFMASQGRGRLTEDDLRRFHIPRVGVVMPVFNAERYLEEALRSMDDQTYRDFEVLAINDGSTDGSRRMLERYIGPNLRIFDLPCNCGVTKALNLGLLVSRSEYLARMDADDVSMPDRLSRQVDFMDENRDVGIVGSMFWSMDESLSSVTWANQDIPLSPTDISMELMNRCCIGHPTIMMRRRVVETIGGYDESPDCKAVEDYELWLRASKRFKIANMPLHLLKHRTYSGQVSSVLAEAQRANFLKVRDRYRSMGATK